MRKKPEFGLGRIVDEWQAGFGSAVPKMLFPLRDTPLLAAGFFISKQ
jgi:hypothetical protein